MQSLSLLSRVSLYALLALMGLLGLVIWFFQPESLSTVTTEDNANNLLETGLF